MEKSQKKRSRHDIQPVSTGENLHDAAADTPFVNELVDALLTTAHDATSRVVSPDGFKTVTEEKTRTRELDTGMYLPISWQPRCKSRQESSVDDFFSRGCEAYEPMKDLFDLLPREENTLKDPWTTMVSRPRNEPSSDDLMKQFLGNLAERQIQEETRNSTLNNKLHSIHQTIDVPTVEPSGSVQKHSESCQQSHSNSTEIASRTDIEASSKTPSETATEKPSQIKETADTGAQTRLDKKPTMLTVATETKLEQQPSEISNQSQANKPVRHLSRLWRPTLDFYESLRLEDTEAPSSDNSSRTETANPDSQDLTSISSESEQASCIKQKRLVKDSATWKHFKQQHYSAQRQRLISKHGIYDPLLFTSSSESKSTSASEFSVCFSKLDLEPIDTQQTWNDPN